MKEQLIQVLVKQLETYQICNQYAVLKLNSLNNAVYGNVNVIRQKDEYEHQKIFTEAKMQEIKTLIAWVNSLKIIPAQPVESEVKND